MDNTLEKIRAVLFDLDGTIADTLPLCIKSFKYSIQPLIGRSISEAEIISTFGVSEEGTIRALIPDHYEKGIHDYLHYYTEFHDMCPAPFEGIIGLLDKLVDQNIRIGMVTGKGKYSTEISLKKFGLNNYFELIETGIETGPIKPEGMKRIINEFQGIPKTEMIYVGDSPSDIDSSRQVGLPVIAAAWAKTADSQSLIDKRPDKIFYTINEFSNWLLKKC